MLNPLKERHALPLPTRISELNVTPFLLLQRLTASDHWQDVRHVELDVSGGDGPALEYKAGDVACVLPEISDDAVAFCADR